MTAIRTDELVQISRDPVTGIRAMITAVDGTQSQVPGEKILAGPPGSQTLVPFKDEWQLRGGTDENPATLQLNTPLAPAIVIVSARQFGSAGDNITVKATPASLSSSTSTPVVANGQPATLTGWVRRDATGWRLVATADQTGQTLARLLPGRDVTFEAYIDNVVIVYGPLHAGDDAPMMIVNRIATLFDVTLHGQSADGETLDEPYPGVSI